MPAKIDLTGQKFGKLTVLYEIEPYIDKHNKKHCRYMCQCECGNTKVVRANSLRNGYTKSCGCIGTGYERICHNGEKYGKLTVIKDMPDKNGKRIVLCYCDCGNDKIVKLNDIRQGKVLSCGCYKQEKSSSKAIDLTGCRIGRLVVIKRAERKNNRTYWECKCDCGNTITIQTSELTYAIKNNKVKSCGCYKDELTSERFSLDLQGKRFGMLTVVERVGTRVYNDGTKHSEWKCVCDCGNEKIVVGSHLTNGSTKSCGCLSSVGEKQIKDILVENDINFKPQYTFDDLRSPTGFFLYFDFAIFKNNKLQCLLEYQGPQHYKKVEFGKQQREITDNIKKEYCKDHNITLLEIKYDQDIEKNIKNIIKALNVNSVPSR